MSKFKVGDIVVGNSQASVHYGITQVGWKGKVTKVYGNGSGFNRHIIVKSLTESNEYIVHEDHFDLVETKNTNMFKNLTASKEFLAKAFEVANPYWKNKIIEIIKDNPFAESYTLTEDILKEAIMDNSICDEWRTKIEEHFEYKSDDLYTFSLELSLHINGHYLSEKLPFFVGDGLANPGEEFKCLIVQGNYELIVDENSKGYKVLKFKKKKS